MNRQTLSEFPAGLSAQSGLTPSGLLYNMFGYLVVFAGLFDMIPGVIFGFIYHTTVHQISIASTSLKAMLFGFILWLFPFAVVIWIAEGGGFDTLRLVDFLGLLLFVVEADAILFANTLDWLAKPPTTNGPTPLPDYVAFIFKPRILAAIGCMLLVFVLGLVTWRLVQTASRLETSLPVQASFFAFVFVAAPLFIYALVYLARFLLSKRTWEAL